MLTSPASFPGTRALRRLLLVVPVLGLALAAGAADTPSPAMSANPLLTPSPLPYHLPPFDLIKDEHFAPAFAQGMAEDLKENEAIANNPDKPTFDNTIVAMERSGELLNRTQRAFDILTASLTNPTLQKLEADLSPQLAAHSDAIKLNPKLFARVHALYEARDTLGLDPESKRLLWRYNKDFVRAGALLSEADKAKLRALNAELAVLSTRFSQNVLKEVAASAVLVDTRAELAGLTDAQIAAMAAAAKAAGHEGKFLIQLQNTTGQPPLDSLTNRALREKIMAASLARGSRGGEFDNRAVVSRIATLRAERANLLGYPTHAAYQLDEQTAGSVDTVNKMLAQLAPPAVANARREAAAMQAIIDAEKGGFQLTASDWDFYAEKVRKEKYAFDESQLKPYFELRRVLVDGVFYAATQLYGITFKERPDLHGYTPDMFVFEVFNADGSKLGLFLGDYYARPNKRGGAWMDAYVPQSGLTGDLPVIANHLNIPKPPAGEPTLLTYDEVKTAFHEFGHALHGLFSNVKYPRFAGTSVPRDFVEFPSQVNEMWRDWPAVLSHYAKHWQTGAPIPPELLAKVAAASKFNQGYMTTELVAANVIDQAWHQLAPSAVPGADGVVAFEAAALKKAGVDFPPVPPRYRSTYFSHSFAGGYSAGYYSYFWSEVLDADTVNWFRTHGGLTRANGDRFRAKLLSRGGSEDAMVLFRDFTGGDPDITPLLERRGLKSN
ncbi:MAG: M3 family metallopeptidase [Verrucomicrobia bacterium]|nr:M3 family metallopeptidase [Verrucomicrobiota bacterium]